MEAADVISARSIDVHIGRLREILGDDDTNPQYIKTVRGVGYAGILGFDPAELGLDGPE
jgi:DNA-binding response OmpR family regulator